MQNASTWTMELTTIGLVHVRKVSSIVHSFRIIIQFATYVRKYNAMTLRKSLHRKKEVFCLIYDACSNQFFVKMVVVFIQQKQAWKRECQEASVFYSQKVLPFDALPERKTVDVKVSSFRDKRWYCIDENTTQHTNSFFFHVTKKMSLTHYDNYPMVQS